MNLDLSTLNDEQRLAVSSTQGPLLVLAGAGSGKTRVLTYRIAYLVNVEGVAPWRILAITFTNKAAAEMRNRLQTLLPDGMRGMWVSTFHAMCVRIIRADAELLGYSSDFSIYDEDDSKRLIKTIMEELNVNPKAYNVQSVRAKISDAKNHMISAEQFSASAGSNPYLVTIAKIYSQLEERLSRANAMDFDDLLIKAYELFKNNPAVLDAYQERFHYIMVDEYQDTNHVQYLLVNLLASKYRNVMVVGDDDQSIYSWRGADISNILDFEKDYPEALTIKLERNYRSKGNILSAANCVVANNKSRKAKRLYTTADAGDKIMVYQAADEREEGIYIAREIEKLHQGGRSYDEFAVFYRTNAQSRILEDMLLRAGVPYRIVGGTRFFDRAEIRDVMAYLKIIANPADDIAALRVINTPRRGIGDSTIQRIQGDAARRACSFLEAVRDAAQNPEYPMRARSALCSFIQIIDDAQGYDGGLRDIVEMIVERSGLIAGLEASSKEEAQSRIENIREFFGVVQEFDESHQEDENEDEPEDFLNERSSYAGQEDEDAFILGFDEACVAAKLAPFMTWLSLRSDLDGLQEGESSITLMTVHSAKGLEFPVVFVAGMEEGVFPHLSFDAGSQKDIEEERRLAYVAITRARERLYLLCTLSRKLFGSSSCNPPSRFIGEIPNEIKQLDGVGSLGFSGFGNEKRGDRHGMFGTGNSGELYGGRVFGGGRNSVNRESAHSDSQVSRPRMAAGPVGRGVATQPAPVASSSKASQACSFAKGDRIDHKTLGRGYIQSVEGDTIHVQFDNGQFKKLLLGYAPIVKIDR